jgi:hypothetical protein
MGTNSEEARQQYRQFFLQHASSPDPSSPLGIYSPETSAEIREYLSSLNLEEQEVTSAQPPGDPPLPDLRPQQRQQQQNAEAYFINPLYRLAMGDHAMDDGEPAVAPAASGSSAGPRLPCPVYCPRNEQ